MLFAPQWRHFQLLGAQVQSLSMSFRSYRLFSVTPNSQTYCSLIDANYLMMLQQLANKPNIPNKTYYYETKLTKKITT